MKHGMHKDKKRKGYKHGMKVDGNKAARREYGYGGRVKLVDGGMPKAKPC